MVIWGIFAFAFPQTAVALDWTARYGVEGGYVAQIAVDYTDSNIAYLASYAGGIFKTTNGGTSWTDLHVTFGSSKIVLDPTNHTTVYVVGGNIVKSTDAGANWTILDTKLPCGDGAKTLVLDPKNTSTLYAIIVTKVGTTADYYVIKSTNGGTSWNQISWNQLSWKAYALSIDPTNSSVLYASTTAGLMKSTDGGVTWNSSGTGLNTINLGTVVIDPRTPSTLYVVADGAVYKSTNSGGQWQLSSNGWESFGDLKAEDPMIDPLSPNNLYVIVKGVGTLSKIPGTIYKTIDAGGRWSPLLFGPPNAKTDVQVVALAPSSPANLYAGTLQHGVYKSVNSGTGWAAKNSGLKVLIEYMALDPTDKNIIYVGIPDFGIFQSTDGGNNWVSRNAGLGSQQVAALAISPVGNHTLWASVNNAVTPSTGGSLPGIFKSNDGGATWTVTIIPPDNFLSSAPTKLVADPVNPDGIYAVGIAGVYRTTDGGTTWFTSRNGVPDNAFLNCLAVDPKNPMVLYLGLYDSTSGNSIYKSTDGGIMWYPSSTGLPNLLGIYDLAIDPKTSSTIYAAVTTNSTGTVNGGVFKSIDSGESWQNTTSEIKALITGYTPAQFDNIHYAGAVPNCPSPFLITAFNLAIDSNTPATLFAVVDGLVLRTTDAAISWAVAHSGLPFTPYQIGISPADQTAAYSANQGIYVYTGTGGSVGGGGGGTATVTVTAPNGGENWLVGSSQNITWTNTGTISNVRIEISTDAGTSYATIVTSTSNTGSYNWTVPNSPSTTVKIRISSDDGSISDTSDDNFMISTAGGGEGGDIFSDLFVPVVLSTSGDGGSFFTTELTFTNRGTLTANVDLGYTATAGGGSGSASITIPPGQSVFSNGIDYLKSIGLSISDTGSRIGTLRAHFSNLNSASDASITARTTTEVKDSGGALIGRAGLAYPALSISSNGGATTSQVKNSPRNLPGRINLANSASLGSSGLNDSAYICGLRQNTTDRSNAAFQNLGAAGDGSITLQVTIFDGNSPFSQALPLIVLEPGAFHQISDVLASNGLSLTNGYAKVERIAGTAPYYAYGVVNDQVNSDGSFVSPQPGEMTGGGGLTLPVIVQTSAFISELDLTNFSSQDRTINFSFVAAAITTEDKTAQFSISIPAGRQQIIPDIFDYMRNNAVAGIGPAGTTIAGALFATATGGDISGVVLGARTSAAGGTVGGRFGLFYTAVPYGQASTTSAWVFGLQQNSENRTNLAIVNTGETDASDDTFVIDLYDGATGNIVKTMDPIVLKARGWIQIGTILNSAPGNVQQGYARVRRTVGNNPFITYAVINDGAGPGQRTGDGAYIGSSQ